MARLVDIRRLEAAPGDNSNTQYALLGLEAASEAGVAVKPEVWALARSYWESSQRQDGSWTYTPNGNVSTASMACAGVSSLIISRHWSSPLKSQEALSGERFRDCGKGVADLNVEGGLDWLATHFRIDENFGMGRQWAFYYLYGLERAARLSGTRLIGRNDWFRLGATHLIGLQDKHSGTWEGDLNEREKVLATSFALMFLAKGRTPVLINKLRRVPSSRTAKKSRASSDWNNDPDDIRNVVDTISHDRKSPMTWQLVDSRTATVADLRRAPILFFNGHRSPDFADAFQETMRDYVMQGGTIVADACCDSPDFDRGFRALMAAMFSDEEYKLRVLPADHPIYRAKNPVDPESYPLWGIRHGARDAIIYSPKDLSCYWNQMHRNPANRAVIAAAQIGRNMVEYITNGR